MVGVGICITLCKVGFGCSAHAGYEVRARLVVTR